MIDGDTTDNPHPFDGGVFQGNDGTMYVFGTIAGNNVVSVVITSSLVLNGTTYPLAATPSAFTFAPRDAATGDGRSGRDLANVDLRRR